jgi:pyridoxal phosphate enzyme (YggS family)
MSIKENLDEIHSLLKTSPKNVTLIAVSKTKPIQSIEEAIHAGQRVFGENKIKEGIEKFSSIKEKYNLTLHHLGPVQSGNSKKLFGIFDYTHGVSSLSSLENLLKESEKYKKHLKYFLQVNLTVEDSKSGFLEDELLKLVQNPTQFETEFLKLEGLMTMGPSSGEVNLTKLVFHRLNEIRNMYIPGSKLSMGMSGDYPLAIAEGSDYIRVGSSIFGERNYN